MSLEVVVCEKEQDYQNALYIRRIVFIEEQQVPEELEIDDHEKDAIHFVVYDQNREPVGAGRLRNKGNMAKVERICVLKNRRGEHIGEALMGKLEQVAEEKGFTNLLLNAQTHAQGFYEKLGYKVTSDLFYEAGIPHVEMKKNV
ncbi:GNAT family N-acetyltransferase [Pullulanibacillus sp. KACC 23026]|uniref:GNAT family N-acetyltransferase n=1 Tax=Pullulanibacillus sp. KACC 23026 TaxID=3028315 RepID=UPI0023AF144F|nr:GNAT family N-acetyltransferase [Pullulanibacillus sp. KACC 23026]WEG11901.1 GNAT family N-acetyltransferase [Pullulanibacillus sp. KACC 23026]